MRNFDEETSDKMIEVVKAAGSAALGTVAGVAVVEATGATAIGVLAAGAGWGAAAGPVGAAAGALVGLAGYGLYKLFS